MSGHTQSRSSPARHRPWRLECLEDRTVPAPIVAVGAGAGGAPQVNVYGGQFVGTLERSFLAYDPSFTGGVRVASADFNGDNILDVVTAPGPGGGPDVRVFDGATGALISEFLAYDPGVTSGVFVAAGDVDGGGTPEIVTGVGAGSAPHVRVFHFDGTAVASFFAYDTAFTGGVNVAAGDVTGDGKADVITGAGPGGGPHVREFDGATGALVRQFFAFDTHFIGGVYVAAGDLNGDSRADIVIGAGPGGGPHVSAFDGTTLAVLDSFFAYGATFTGGVRVGVVADVNGDGAADIVTAAGPGGGPHTRVFSGRTAAPLTSYFAFDPTFLGGVFVGGS
jgi:FG-GAP repeat